MKHILLTKIFPVALRISVFVLLFFASDENETWLWIAAGLFILDGLASVGLRLKKTSGIKITDDSVFVGGLELDRRNISAWRMFRVLKNGERVRYIEIELEQTPLSSLEWKLAKLFEQLPTSKRWERGIPLAREPRIIAPLNSSDLTKSEIEQALQNSAEA